MVKEEHSMEREDDDLEREDSMRNNNLDMADLGPMPDISILDQPAELDFAIKEESEASVSNSMKNEESKNKFMLASGDIGLSDLERDENSQNNLVKQKENLIKVEVRESKDSHVDRMEKMFDEVVKEDEDDEM